MSDISNIDKKSLEELLDQLTINDIYIMMYIVSKWLSRMEQVRKLLQTNMRYLGLAGSTSEKTLIMDLAQRLLAQQGYKVETEPQLPEPQLDKETLDRLQKAIKSIKEKARGQSQPQA